MTSRGSAGGAGAAAKASSAVRSARRSGDATSSCGAGASVATRLASDDAFGAGKQGLSAPGRGAGRGGAHACFSPSAVSFVSYKSGSLNVVLRRRVRPKHAAVLALRVARTWTSC